MECAQARWANKTAPQSPAAGLAVAWRQMGNNWSRGRRSPVSACACLRARARHQHKRAVQLFPQFNSASLFRALVLHRRALRWPAISGVCECALARTHRSLAPSVGLGRAELAPCGHTSAGQVDQAIAHAPAPLTTPTAMMMMMMIMSPSPPVRRQPGAQIIGHGR